jgi:transcription termination/antitermination protein NusA
VADEEESYSRMFQRTLHTTPELAHALEAEGFTCIDEVAYVPLPELLEVRGLTEESALSLRNIARLYLLNEGMGEGPDFKSA